MKRIIMIMCVISAIYMGTTMVFAEEPEYTYNTVRVTSGDTLWDIATHYAEPGDDLHEVIFNICQWNNLKSKNLQPGQVLKIRVKASNKIMLAKR